MVIKTCLVVVPFCYCSRLVSLVIIRRSFFLELKGPSHAATPLFLFPCESLAIIFYSAHVKMNEINAKLLKQ